MNSKGNLISSSSGVAENFSKYFAGIAALIKTEIAARMISIPEVSENPYVTRVKIQYINCQSKCLRSMKLSKTLKINQPKTQKLSLWK